MLTIFSRMDNTEIAARVKELRLGRGWSQRQLEDRASLGNGYISALESGKLKSKPKVATLNKVAVALGVPLRTFRDDDEDVPEIMDPRIEQINAHLLTMRALDNDEVTQVEAIVRSMVEDLKRRRRERENAERP
jgi:transcriptional regulator with XRE-family HTH domain